MGPRSGPAFRIPAGSILPVVFALWACFGSVAAAQVHVDPENGSDAAGDGSQASPWRSLTHTIGQISPPETVLMSPGEYRASTGESFPIRVPAGISLIATGNPEDTWIRGPGIAFMQPTLLIEPSEQVGAVTLVRGLRLDRGLIGVRIDANGSGPSFGVALDDLELFQNGQYGVFATVAGGVHLDLDLRSVRTVQMTRAVRVAVQRGSAHFGGYRSELNGVVVGVELRATGPPGVSILTAELSAVSIRNSTSAGLLSVVTEGNQIATHVRDSIFRRNATCIAGPYLPGSGAVVDQGAALGSIQHLFKRTIFHENGAGCILPSGSVDLVTYRPEDYTLLDNLYGWSHPGGQVTGDPGFVGASPFAVESEFDLHLRADALALDGGSGPAAYTWGDLDGHFAVQDPTSPLFDPNALDEQPCFPGAPDIGAHERRKLSVYAHPFLRVGEVTVLRVLGPSAPPTTPVLGALFAGSPPATVPACPTGFGLGLDAVLVGTVWLDPTTGVGSRSFGVPPLPELAGQTLAVQAVSIESLTGDITWSPVRFERVRR